MSTVLVRNHVKVLGEGDKTIIFAHGFGCDQNMWRYITPFFEKNYRVVLFDHVGSGNSDLTAYDFEKYSTLHGYAQDVLDIIETLKLNDVIFVGHSVSSMIGMLASIERPESFYKLVMIGPSPRYINDGDKYHGGFEKNDVLELLTMMEMNYLSWASFMAPLGMNNPEVPALTAELENSFTRSNPIITRQFAETTFFSDHRADLGQAKVSTLIMQCSDDSIVPLMVGNYLHEHMKNSTLYLMEAKGHYPHLSHPQETINCINNFLT
ncbi:sigma-B regulation protein RsbQ [Psychrobacillus sp. OK028]|uniref:alpha/beta fold hydrolase n=1 Tax=Psychrobacillus sp. OK028 TaxID=1884359 RepID=UPI0008834BF5|nr:alpha/beta hydrolase [Psychrobacillus sp. OK028]SDO27247.1 sigma-B regulation protein RsbQ [Psychrobacillus sp. OK028]